MSARAGPGFEVRGGANGLENLKRGGGGGGHIYFKYTTITIAYIYMNKYINIYLSITIHFKIQILGVFYYNNTVYLKPLILYCSKKILFEIFFFFFFFGGGGARPVRPPLNPPLVCMIVIHHYIFDINRFSNVWKYFNFCGYVTPLARILRTASLHLCNTYIILHSLDLHYETKLSGPPFTNMD